MEFEQMKWIELETRGLLTINAFLSDDEVAQIRRDCAEPAPASEHRSYYMKFPSPLVVEIFRPKVTRLTAEVRQTTSLDVDLIVGFVYFVTIPPKPMKPQVFGWHQDHEDWFAFQEHRNCLNFYVPIFKPKRDASNLTLLPFDILKEKSAASHDLLVGGGARHLFSRSNGTTEVEDDNDDRRLLLDVDIDTLAVTPQLDVGDLLLWRGDVVHRTQDAETERVAVKIVVMNGDARITRGRLRSGGVTKYCRLLKNVEFYECVLSCFNAKGRDEVSVREMNTHLNETYYPQLRRGRRIAPVSIPEFLFGLTREDGVSAPIAASSVSRTWRRA